MDPEISTNIFPDLTKPVHLVGESKSGRVWINQVEIFPEKSLKLRNHSPTGFAWGYGGSGPAQLALAICLELFGKDNALKMYQAFKRRYIETLPQTDFSVILDFKNDG